MDGGSTGLYKRQLAQNAQPLGASGIQSPQICCHVVLGTGAAHMSYCSYLGCFYQYWGVIVVAVLTIRALHTF